MRNTPISAGLGQRTPDQSIVAVANGRGGIPAARALAIFAERMSALGASHDLDGAKGAPVRDALRQLVSRTRHASLQVRLADDAMSIDGAPVTAEELLEDPSLDDLRHRMSRRGIGSIAIRDGAAPGELLTLGRLLSGLVGRGADASRTQAHNADGDEVYTPPDAELLRTWSVLVLRAGIAAEVEQPVMPTALPFVQLANARSDQAALKAVTDLADDIDDVVRRKDSVRGEQIALAFARAIESAGTGAGRLALEAGMRRLLRMDMIALLAERLPQTVDRDGLLAVFARAGETGVKILAECLIDSSSAVARRAYFDAIVAMDVGGSVLRQSLNDPRWFVVRNTAALLGEMNVADADTPLIHLLAHPDERLRIAAARALVRLRTPRALAALHAAVDDSNPEVRRLAATSYSVAVNTPGIARPNAHRLAEALKREQDDDVALEMMAAMGRLGSADAVQRLLRIAQSPTVDSPGAAGAEERGYIPQPTWLRIAAIEALVDARGDAVLPAVEALMSDSDPQVADAAWLLRRQM